MYVNQVKHLLTLKVMRLAKPTLSTNVPVTCEDGRLPVDDPCSPLVGEDPSTVRGAETVRLGEMLPPPRSCGNVFLGETFSSSVSVRNASDQTVRNVLVRADLQTSSHRLNIPLLNSRAAELTPGCCVRDVLHHEIQDLEPHVLVCTVSYTTQRQETLVFRRLFRFKVLKPLNVETKFHNAETDEVFLEAHVQNWTTSSMFMERASLEPSAMYTVKELHTVSGGDRASEESVFGNLPRMQPMDTRHYLYCLKPRPECAEEAAAAKGVTAMGRLDITWTADLGQRRRLQSSQLQRVAPWYGDVRLSVEVIPDTVGLEEPFDLLCKVTNCSGRNVDLVSDLCATRSIRWCCVSGRRLGTLSPAASLSLPLTLLFTAQGLQSVGGLRLTDRLQRRTHKYDDIAQVCVVRPYASDECEN